jgi:hypothetical protein
MKKLYFILPLLLIVFFSIYSCNDVKRSSNTINEALESLEGKYIKNVVNNTIHFEDGTSYKIDEKKYLKTLKNMVAIQRKLLLSR